MALKDEFETRIPLQRRIEISNATDDLSPTAVQDDAKVDAAVLDVTGDFVTYAGVTLDDTTPNAEHIAHGVEGVVLYLEAYKGDTEAWKKVAEWRDKVTKNLRLTQGNNRIRPKSASKRTRADDTPEGTIRHPDFDPNADPQIDITPGRTRRERFPRIT